MKKNRLWILCCLAALGIMTVSTATACKKTGSDTSGSSQESELKAKVTLDKETVTMTIFDSVKLTATTQNTQEDVVFTSSDESVLTVSADGTLQAQKVGTATVTATAGDATATCTVTVAEATGVNVYANTEEVSIALMVGNTHTIQAYASTDDADLEGGTFTFTSSNESAVTVSESGVITAVGKGSAVITIGGTYKGITMQTTTVEVAVSEKLEVESNVDGLVSIYLSEGRNAEAPLATTYTVQPTIKLNGEVVTNLTAVLTSSTENVVSISGNTVTAVGAGSTTITVTVTSASGTVETATFSVNVAKPVSKIATENLVIGMNKANSFTQFGVTDEIVAIKQNDVAAEYTLENGNLTITGLTAGEKQKIAIETPTEILEYTVDVMDYLIANKEEFLTFMQAVSAENYASGKYYYGMLTADIDYEGGHLQNDMGKVESDWNSFYLNGAGHVISNATSTHGIFAFTNGTAARNTVIKNTGFVNITKSVTNGGGMLINQAFYTTIENCYVQSVLTGAAGSLCTGLIGNNSCGYMTLKNVVVNVEFPGKPNTHYAITYAKETTFASYENVYAISSTSNGKAYDGAEEGEGVYTNAKAFREAVTSMPEGFNAEYWTMEEGILAFKAAIPYYTKVTEISVSTTATALATGSSVNFTASKENTTFALKEAVEGVSITANGVLTVAENAPVGSTVTVVGSFIDPFFGHTVTAESATLTIEKTTRVTMSETAGFIAKNKDGAQFTYDASAIESLAISEVTFNGKAVTGYTFENGIITIPAGAFTSANGAKNLTVFGSAGEHNLYVLTQELEVIDFSIATKEEFLAFRDSINGSVQFAKLAADIDLENITVADFTKTFAGVFDGMGHTVSNVNVTRSLFGMIGNNAYPNTEFKNVGFVNVTRIAQTTGGLLAHQFDRGVMDNVYFQGKANGYNITGVVYAVDHDDAQIKNCVFDVDFGTKPNVVVGYSDTSWNATANNLIVNNTYAISSTSTGYMFGQTSTGVYTSVAEFKASVTSIPEGFNTEYWKMEDGLLVFKSVLSHFTKVTEISVSTSVAALVPGATVTYTASQKGTTFALKEAVEGVSITAGGVLTVSETAPLGASVVVVGTYVDPFYGNTVTAESTALVIENTTKVTMSETTALIAKNKDGAQFSFDTKTVANLTIGEITFNGVRVTDYSFENGILTIPATALKSYDGAKTLSVLASAGEHNAYILTQQVEVVDFAIGTAAELDAFARIYNTWDAQRYAGIVILTADIDYGGSHVWADSVGHWGANQILFYGVFDGRGHVIDNIYLKSFFPDLKAGAIVRNVALINVQKSGNAMAPISTLSYGTIENVFVQCVMNENGAQTSADYCAGISHLYENAVVRNVVVYTQDFKNSAKFPVISTLHSDAISITNTYAVTDGSNGKLYGDVTDGVYTTVADFKAGVTAVPEGMEEFWEMKDGVLTFKGVNTYMQAKASTYAVTGANKVVANTENTLAANFTVSKWELAEEVEGVSIVNGKLVVASTVANNTKVTVRAYYFNKIYGKDMLGATGEITVTEAEVITLTTNVNLAKNKNAKYTYAIENVKEGAKVLSATFGGNALSSGVSIVDGEIVVDASVLTAGLNGTLAVIFENDGAYYMVKDTVNVYDFAMSNKDEFLTFFKAVAAVDPITGKYYYGMLTANIDYAGGCLQADMGTINGNYNNFYLDGFGYSVANIDVYNGSGKHGAFALLKGTADHPVVFKNIGLVNMVKSNPNNGGGVLSNEGHNVIFENVYIDTKLTAACGVAAGVIGNESSNLVFRNVLVNTHLINNTYNAIAYKNTGVKEFTNSYVIAPVSSGKLYGDVTEGLYKSYTEFKAVVTEVPEGFNTEYWTMENGMLVFKSARTVIDQKQSVASESYAITSNLSAIAGTETDLTANFTVSKWELVEAVAGVSVANGKLVIANTVAAGTTITVKGYYADYLTEANIEGATATFTVVEAQKVTISTKTLLGKNKTNATYDYTVETEGDVSVAYVMSGSTTLAASNYSVEGNVIKVKVSGLTSGLNGTLTILYKSGDTYYQLTDTVDVYDFAVATKDEFLAFREAMNGSVQYACLTADIDLENITVADFVKTFAGIFDGMGHTVSNVNVTRSLFGMIGNNNYRNTEFKNAAFVNVTRIADKTGGLLAHQFDRGVMDNIYFQGKANGFVVSGVVYAMDHDDAQIKNCVFDVDFANNPNVIVGYSDTSWNATANDLVVTNTYGISTNSKGYMFGQTTTGFFANAKAYKEGVTSIPEGFNTEYWTMEEGMLAFKTAIPHFTKVTEITVSTTATTLVPGTTANYTASKPGVTYALKQAVEGVSINNNGVLTLALDAPANASVVVVATYIDPFYGNVVTAESTALTIESVTSVVMNENTVLIARNTETKQISYDTTGLGALNIMSITYNGKAVTGYTFEAGVLTITDASLSNSTDVKTLSVLATAGDKYYVLTQNLQVVDYAIATKADFTAFAKAFAAENYSTGKLYYGLLTADIDYEGGHLQNDMGTVVSSWNAFYLDGAGHSISNVTSTHGIFVSTANAVIRNVAFLNITKSVANGGGMLINQAYNTTIENCYVQSVLTGEAGNIVTGLVGSNSNSAMTLRNIVVNVEFPGKPNTHYAITYSGESHLKVYENVYAISSNSNGKAYNGAAVGDGVYTTADAFAAANVTLGGSFEQKEDGLYFYNRKVVEFTVS